MSEQETILKGHEAIRKRPGMYFGAAEDAGNHILFEFFSNACDQCLAGKASHIVVTVVDKRIVVYDDGEGIPFDLPATQAGFHSLAEQYITQRIDAPTADGHAPHVHLGIGRGGLGIYWTSAVCESLIITSVRDGQAWQQSFSRGLVVSAAKQVDCDFEAGTRIEAVIDEEIYPNDCFDMPTLRRDIFEICHLFPKLNVTLNDEVFAPKNGLLDLAVLYGFSGSNRHFAYYGIEEGVEINVACVEHEHSKTNVTPFYSWANGLRTNLGGTHVTGLQNALKVNGFMPNVALISVLFHDATYASPTKEKLVSKKAAMVVEKVLTKAIADWKTTN